MNFLKKHSILAAIVVAVVVIIALIAWYMMGRGGAGSNNPAGQSVQNIKQISPEAIGLAVALNKDGKSLDLSANKLDGVQSLDYEVTYDALETDPESGDTSVVSKGVQGTIDANGSSVKRNILLGTCSANVCRYDKVKSDITITIKVTYKNGDVAGVSLKVPYSGGSDSSGQ